MSDKNNHAAGYYPTASREEQDWYRAQIEPATSRWMQNEVSQAHMVVTLIAGANAGGAVAILAYIGQPAPAGVVRAIANPDLLLLGYVCGFVTALLLAVCIYYASLRRLTIWLGRVSLFYSGKHSWRDVWAKQKPAWYGGNVLHILAWSSLLFFLAASGLGITQMLSADHEALAESPSVTQTQCPELAPAQTTGKAPTQIPENASAQAPEKATARTPENVPAESKSK